MLATSGSLFMRRVCFEATALGARRIAFVPTAAVLGTRSFAPAYWHLESAPESKRSPPAAKPIKGDPKAGELSAGAVFHDIQVRAGAGKFPPFATLHSLCAVIDKDSTRLLTDALKIYRRKLRPSRESTATHVLKACLRANDADLALSYFKDRAAYGLLPSLHALHLLLFRFALMSSTQPEAAAKAATAHELLQLYGYQTNEFSAAQLVRAYTNAGTPEDLVKAVDAFQLPGGATVSPVKDAMPAVTVSLIKKIKADAETSEKLLGKLSTLLKEWETKSGFKLPKNIADEL